MHGLELMYNDDPVCPYCRAVQKDSFELGLQNGEKDVIECWNCCKIFKVECHIDYTYSSVAIPCRSDKTEEVKHNDSNRG